MEFTLRISSSSSTFAFTPENIGCGLAQLRECRDKHPDASAKQLMSVSTQGCDPDVTLTEKQAEESGVYEEDSFNAVVVPANFLNQFCTRSYEEQEDGTIHVTPRLDEQAAIEAWVAAKAPSMWGFLPDDEA